MACEVGGFLNNDYIVKQPDGYIDSTVPPYSSSIFWMHLMVSLKGASRERFHTSCEIRFLQNRAKKQWQLPDATNLCKFSIKRGVTRHAIRLLYSAKLQRLENWKVSSRQKSIAMWWQIFTYNYRTAQELQSLAKSAFALNNLEISGQPQ
jgi:hypothetical protein